MIRNAVKERVRCLKNLQGARYVTGERTSAARSGKVRRMRPPWGQSAEPSPDRRRSCTVLGFRGCPPAGRLFCVQSAGPGRGEPCFLQGGAPHPTDILRRPRCSGARRERRSGGRAARGEEGGAGNGTARCDGRGGSGGAGRHVLVPAGADGGRAPPLPAPAAGAGRRLQPGRGERDRPARGAGQPLRFLAGHAPAAAAAGETAVSAAVPRPGPSFRRRGRPWRRGAPGYHLPAGGGGEGGTCRGALGGGEAPAAGTRGSPGRNGGERAAAPGRRLLRLSCRRPSVAGGAAGRWDPAAVLPEPALRGRVRALEGSRPARAAGRSCAGWHREYWDGWRDVGGGEEVPSLRRESEGKSSMRPEEGWLGLRAPAFLNGYT